MRRNKCIHSSAQENSGGDFVNVFLVPFLPLFVPPSRDPEI